MQGHAAVAEVKVLAGLPSFVCCLCTVKMIDFRFFGHDKCERPEACLETAGWMDSLALYKCRAFGPRFLLATYFRLAGGTNPTQG